jgi:hypothetical protein
MLKGWIFASLICSEHKLDSDEMVAGCGHMRSVRLLHCIIVTIVKRKQPYCHDISGFCGCRYEGHSLLGYSAM